MTIYQTWGSAEILMERGAYLTFEQAKLVARGQLMTNVRRETGVQEVAATEKNPALNWVRYAGPREDIHALLKAEPDRITYHRWQHGGHHYVQAKYQWEES